MEDPSNQKRKLGLLDSTMLVAGSMIGSGIFIVTADMARSVGSTGYVLLLWLITGVITLIAALSYGELAGMMPKAGGQFVYIQRAFGKMTAFLYGWTVFTVIQTGVIAAVAVAFANYTSFFFPELNHVLIKISSWSVSGKQFFAIGSLVLLTFINSRGIQNGKIIQLVFTSAKLVALFALIILGIAFGLRSDVAAQNFSHLWDASSSVLKDGVWSVSAISGLVLIGAMGTTIINPLFSSDAWNNVTFIAGEIREPEKNIPRSLFFGTFIVTIIYILANVAYLCLLPLKGDPNATDTLGLGIQYAAGDRVGAAAAAMIFGKSGAAIMAVLIMVSTFGCNNGLILSGARVYYTMAKEKLFLKTAATLNQKQVPGKALWLQCTWASVLCLSGTYGDLLDYCTFASLLFYIITITGVFILRKKEPGTPRPYKAFGYPFLPALYIIIAAAICVTLLIFKTKNAGIGLLIVALGIPVYYISNQIQNRKSSPLKRI